MQPLIVTQFTAANALGLGARATLAALEDNRTGLIACDFETAVLDTFVGRIGDTVLLPLRTDLTEFDCRNNRIAQLALRQDGFEDTVAAARDRYGAQRIGVFLGTSTSGILHTELAYRRRDPDTGTLPADFRYATRQNNFSLAWFVQSYCGLAGPALVVSTACSSSAKVFATASRMIEAELCDAAIVGGADSLCLTTLYGFGSLQLLSNAPCRPFDVDRDGISIGEGAGFMLLEKAESAGTGNAIAVRRVGESSDAHHMSTPHPEGTGARLAMEHALRSAGVSRQEIDYINLHGTGTRSNDVSEEKAVFELFRDRIACSSTKGYTGHTLGASGILEAIISVLAIEHGFVPGSVNTREVDPAVRLDYVIEKRAAAIDTVLSNSFGFGGTNCSVVFARWRR
ncbi:MAG: beta-ketoacyl-[acyl-carrier-protein] synthase family protein [Burkholderiales bacterium]